MGLIQPLDDLCPAYRSGLARQLRIPSRWDDHPDRNRNLSQTFGDIGVAYFATCCRQYGGVTVLGAEDECRLGVRNDENAGAPVANPERTPGLAPAVTPPPASSEFVATPPVLVQRFKTHAGKHARRVCVAIDYASRRPLG